MHFNKVMGSLFVAALSLGMANAAVFEEIKATTEGAKKFAFTPKITDVDGKTAFVSTLKGYKYYILKEKVKVDNGLIFWETPFALNRYSGLSGKNSSTCVELSSGNIIPTFISGSVFGI